jgi:hydrogenase nickel incorporation protein HypB
MCQDCGCALTGTHGHPATKTGPAQEGSLADAVFSPAPLGAESVTLLRNLLSQNDQEAAHNRRHFDSHAVLAINLMSSPGAGKTSLLEHTIDSLRGQLRMAVIEGDLATENDARRIRAKGVPAIQITTGSACHLDARMVHDALHELRLEGLDVVFIENVGNLVCPASFDLGQHLDVTLLSVPEGDDKPEKYPVMFRAADLLLLSKCDLLEVLPEFDVSRAEASLRTVGSEVPVLRLSSRSGAGLDGWTEWLLGKLEAHRRQLYVQQRA